MMTATFYVSANAIYMFGFLAGIILRDCPSPGSNVFSVQLLTAGYRINDDPHSDDSFRWRQNNGSPLPLTYSNWFGVQPDNSGGDNNCITILPRGGNKWNDFYCYEKCCFVCEIAL